MRRSVAATAVLWAGVWAATAGGQGPAAAAQTGTLRPYEPLQTTASRDGASSAAEPGSGLSGQIRAMLSDPAVSRAHWGVMVTGLDGSPIAAVNEGELFQPASNAKLFTTTAAMALLGQNRTFTTRVTFARPGADGVVAGDLVLMGAGEADLNGVVLPYGPNQAAQMPALHSLAEFADRVAAAGVKEIRGGVIGDDTVFPWEPYPQDWAIDDMVWGYGAPVSGLTMADNEMKVTIAPGDVAGAAAAVTLDEPVDFYALAGAVLTSAPKSAPTVQIARAVGSRTVRVFGTIPAGRAPITAEIAIADPAEYAALALREMLTERGIKVDGAASARHRVVDDVQGFLAESRVPVVLPAAGSGSDQSSASGAADSAAGGSGESAESAAGCGSACPVVLEHTSAPLAEDVVFTNKTSQNLHAELLLRQLGKAYGTDGSAAQGARVVRQWLVNAGVDPKDFVFYDGSGLSGHDLVTPRATARLLAYAAGQPWFAAWRASLPVGGVDGSLAGRFTDAAMKGRVAAKTGTLGEARSLSGYLTCASGQTVVFSVMVGEFMPGSAEVRETMDRLVALIAGSL